MASATRSSMELSRTHAESLGFNAIALLRYGPAGVHGRGRRTRHAFATLFFALASVAFGGQPTPLSPDPTLTPDDCFDVSVADLCVPGYTKSVRNVPESTKREVYAEYGITYHGTGDYEIDHLVPLELGGSNSIKNLWPQSKRTSPWNAQVKDRLENRLHALVCAGKLKLKVAQAAVGSDWIQAYQTYVGIEPSFRPRRLLVAEVSRPLTNNADQVWLNTKSGKYWMPGSRFYGKTKQGAYMDEATAKAQGYAPANGIGR